MTSFSLLSGKRYCSHPALIPTTSPTWTSDSSLLTNDVEKFSYFGKDSHPTRWSAGYSSHSTLLTVGNFSYTGLPTRTKRISAKPDIAKLGFED
ncbi:unnamed protein product [Camellia sinensis]